MSERMYEYIVPHHDSIKDTSRKETFPPPVLVQFNSTALYSVELPKALTNVIDGILLKIEPVDPSIVMAFIPLMPHNETEVSLAPFVYSKVIVSYATVNNSVLSGFSEPAELCINQTLPVRTTTVGVSFKLDEHLPRHAVLNVTWEAPINANSLEYYVLNIVASGTMAYCADLLPLNVIIQPQENSYVVQPHVDRDVPIIGCNYSLTIIAIPSHQASFVHFYIPPAHADDTSYLSTSTSFYFFDSSSTLNLSPSSSLFTSSLYGREETTLLVQNTNFNIFCSTDNSNSNFNHSFYGCSDFSIATSTSDFNDIV
ncbi:hypothetical protein EMCRGX_G013561 [Ephydatia muelleri]